MKPLKVKWHIPVALLVLSGLILFLLTAGFESPDRSGVAADEEPAGAQPEESLPEKENSWEMIEARVQSGATASSLLSLYLSPGEIHRLAEQSRPIFPLSRLGAGQRYRLYLDEETLVRFEYDINADDQLIILPAESGGFKISREPIAYEIRQELVRGSIRSNLFEAVAASNELVELALSLADIFAWDIDFIRDLRQGDSFQALIEKRFREGEPAGYGRILAAEFINRSTTHRAFWFQNGESGSYYDPEGRNIRKAFLRAPLSFTRISSGFSTRRLHPITKTWRAHPAIDYAAPPGTPIMTVGDGVITEIGYNRNNGNYIKIRHKGGYETIYLHMQGFAKAMQKNKRLTQGQVIGYVGSTGLATGPHLCFRMLRNGTPVNPQTVKAPNAEPIPAARMAEFKAAISPFLALLEEEEAEKMLLGKN